MPDPISDTTLRKLAAVYAEAVLTFLDSGEAQWVVWDRASDRFDFASVEMDRPEAPVLLFVDASWSRLCEVDVPIDPDEAQFNSGALRSAVEAQIADEGLGERILKGYLERLADAEEDEEETEEPEREPNDDNE